MTQTRYILTLSCADAKGIVAAVAGFLTRHDGFIIESAQFGDPSTNRFFMRVDFALGGQSPVEEALKLEFEQEVATPFAMHWRMEAKDERPKVVILVSKHSHCLNDLLYRQEIGALPIEIPAIISNHATLQKIADRHGVPFHHFPIGADKHIQEAKIRGVIDTVEADVVVLARYMQILSAELCEYLAGRCINIHHSFLPSFKGADPYKQAYNRGVKLIGATAHYVTPDLDEGPIIEQEVARVDHSLSPEQLTAAGRDIECATLARALAYHIEHRVLPNGIKTVVFR